MVYTKKNARQLMAKLKLEEGNYTYKCGFPMVFEDSDDIYIVSGKLARESEQKDGPYYVGDFVKDDDIYIVDESEGFTVYRVNGLDDIVQFMNGNTDDLEIEEREVLWC